MDYYGTLGPACNNVEILCEMIKEGMTGIRLNLSHGNLDDNKEYIYNLRKAEEITGIKMKLLIDIKGPELRIGKLKNNLTLVENENITLGEHGIPVPKIIFTVLEKNIKILIDDGKILLSVISVNNNSAVCNIERGGVLKSNKSIAIPECKIYIPTLTEDDKINISKVKEYDVAGVMLPFVRSKDDVLNLKNELLKNNCDDIKIFAKIENKDGIEKLDELMEYVDLFVIARGDLGNSMNLWELPVAQKIISEKCVAKNKPFMVVTQMLDSMHNKKVPTRAEVLDIFNAVIDGANSVMLTGETAAGNYPVDAMKYLVKTGNEAVKYKNKQ